MSNTAYQDLLQAISGIPKLPGAACRHQHALFEDPERVAEAITICETLCPSLRACREWSDTLRFNQIDGVIGGQHRIWVSHPSLAKGNP
jgi:hypothetical protein